MRGEALRRLAHVLHDHGRVKRTRASRSTVAPAFAAGRAPVAQELHAQVAQDAQRGIVIASTVLAQHLDRLVGILHRAPGELFRPAHGAALAASGIVSGHGITFALGGEPDHAADPGCKSGLAALSNIG
jgi:hypothetical protein